MKIKIQDLTTAKSCDAFVRQLTELGFTLAPDSDTSVVQFTIVDDFFDSSQRRVAMNHRLDPIEQFLQCLDFDFSQLPPLVEGESKELKLLTDKVVIERLKPTVYSFTHNRYGVVEGTDIVRARFSAEVFRQMSLAAANSVSVQSAFLGLVETSYGPLMVQRRVEDSNLEIRVKRYHVGSPLHRYRYTERYSSTQSTGPLKRWSRFDKPVVCFDWRHPLTDDDGNRLADEAISDDYASMWVEDVAHAKSTASWIFSWLESLMANAGLVLVDMCMFIDRTGRIVFGEISPDCMRVRQEQKTLESSESFDKDIWRRGGSPKRVLSRYQQIFDLVFAEQLAKE